MSGWLCDAAVCCPSTNIDVAFRRSSALSDRAGSRSALVGGVVASAVARERSTAFYTLFALTRRPARSVLEATFGRSRRVARSREAKLPIHSSKAFMSWDIIPQLEDVKVPLRALAPRLLRLLPRSILSLS